MSFTVSFERLALYNRWMNENIYQAAETLSVSELTQDRGAYFSSIIGTLNHIMVGDIFWFKRFSTHKANFTTLEYFRTIENPNSLKATVHKDLSLLKQQREIIDQHIVLFTAQLTDEILASSLEYKNTVGKDFSKNMGYLLQHVFNHQTHHRGQISTLLYQASVDVGLTDMLEQIPNDLL